MSANFVLLTILIQVGIDSCVCSSFQDYNDYYEDYNEDEYNDDYLQQISSPVAISYVVTTTQNPIYIKERNNDTSDQDSKWTILKEGSSIFFDAFDQTLNKESGEGNAAIEDPLLEIIEDSERIAAEHRNIKAVSSAKRRPEVYTRPAVSTSSKVTSNFLWLPASYLVLYSHFCLYPFSFR